MFFSIFSINIHFIRRACFGFVFRFLFERRVGNADKGIYSRVNKANEIQDYRIDNKHKRQRYKRCGGGKRTPAEIEPYYKELIRHTYRVYQQITEESAEVQLDNGQRSEFAFEFTRQKRAERKA